ncbi:hypothetical protein G6F56_006711 [Rhizopus delemar]|nr:hypothetical protein G6F56_006711 [Rhizopus delemar]
MKSVSRLERLPVDIIIQILDCLDQYSQWITCTLSKLLSELTVRRMWHTPKCTSLQAFHVLLSSLKDKESYYAYASFLVNLHLSMDRLVIEPAIPELQLKTLWIENMEFISFQALCHVDMQAVYFSNCATDVIQSIIVKQSARLEKIMIYDCPVADEVFYEMVAPSLRYFSYCRSGFISDAAIAAIVQHCPCVEALVLTLPRNIVQANTMTQASLDSLIQFKCLKVLICKGQIRIANGEYKNWLYKNIPSLEYCDLSFDL